MKKPVVFFCSLIILLLAACTFDYGENGDSERETPDLIMRNVVYIRIRSSDPIARFEAELAERFEQKGVMVLHNVAFEQYGEKGTEVHSFGNAGYASVEIESGDVFMDKGVRMEIESEDIILETTQLEWKDEPRILSSGKTDTVEIFQENGTNFTGIGLYVEVRNHTWEFSGAVSGIFISDDDEKDEDGDDDRDKIETKPEEIGYIDEPWHWDDEDDEIK